MMKKRIAFTLLPLLLVGVLGACNQNNDGNSSEDSPSSLKSFSILMKSVNLPFL